MTAMTLPRASYLAPILAAALHGCGSGESPLPGTRAVGECPEIYASGFRNPWRWSFDRLTGELWVGDVGQGAREEVDRVVRGGNYGWRCFEGTLATGLGCGSEPNLLPPVAEYERTITPGGKSVTGGYVYRGSAIMGLAGRYVFGDFVIGRIWSIPNGTAPTLAVSSGFDSTLSISSFGEGVDGELYVVHYGGQLYRLTGTAAVPAVQQVFTSLPSFSAPVAMLQVPGDGTRWFVVEQAGIVRVFDNDPAVATASVFVDIRARVTCCGEMGLLGMAFHPQFAANGRVYLSYINSDSGRVSRISEFTASADRSVLLPGTERILLEVGQPETNHNGGHLAFGPDGYLYVGIGDGGGANDQHGPIGNGQLMTTLLGKMLRIDVDGAFPYAIPPDNPFAAFASCGTP